MSLYYAANPHRSRKLVIFLQEIVLLIFTFSCSNGRPTDSKVTITDIQINPSEAQRSNMTLEPYSFMTSEPGMVTIHGTLVVLDPTSILPDEEDAIFLVLYDQEHEEAGRIPQFVVGEVPQAEVDERTGEFVFTNIPPGRYIVAVLTMSGAQFPARRLDTHELVVVNVDATHLDQTIDLGSISLP